MDEDTLYEMRRMDVLDFIESYFLHRFSIPDCFLPWSNCKMGDKYIIKLSNNDKKCAMTLEIDIDLYRKVDSLVTYRDLDVISFEDIDKELDKN